MMLYGQWWQLNTRRLFPSQNRIYGCWDLSPSPPSLIPPTQTHATRFFPCPPCEPATCSRTCCTAASLQQQMNMSVNSEESEWKHTRCIPHDCCLFSLFRGTLDPSAMIQTRYRVRQFHSENDLVTSILFNPYTQVIFSSHFLNNKTPSW